MNRICSVCGDKAIGINFLALTCESCKSFFRRTALKPDQFRCHFKGKCEITPMTRKFCRKCRLNKCFATGMKKELILNEEEKYRRYALKDERIKVRKTNKKSSICDSTTPLEEVSVSYGNSSKSELSDIINQSEHGGGCGTQTGENKNILPECEKILVPIPRPLTDYNNNFNELEGIKICELLNATQLTNIAYTRITSESMNYFDAIELMANKREEEIRKTIKISKNISAFRNLCEIDQISLLKYGAVETVFIGSVETYNKECETWAIPVDENNSTLLRLELLKDSKVDLYNAHKTFLNYMVDEFDSDNNILDLLSLIEQMLAIVLFNPERPDLIHRDLIRFERGVYMHLLQRYLQLKYRSESEAKTRLLRLIIGLKNLNVLNQTYIRFYTEETPKYFSPLLKEIYDRKTAINSIIFS